MITRFDQEKEATQSRIANELKRANKLKQIELEISIFVNKSLHETDKLEYIDTLNKI